MFNYSRNVRLNDTDPAGVIFFARVYDIAHEAFEALLIELENPIQNIIKSDVIYPLVNSNANYLGPIKLGDILKINVTTEKLSDSSFTLLFAFHVNNNCVSEVRTTQVAIKRSEWKKTVIEEKFRLNLEKLKS
jgi:1,4-dihydroxy-2-naphthoyl-CoA hydrolase